MSYSPLLLLHIASGTAGMLSGFITVFLKKGARRHAIAGKVFVVSMVCLTLSGTYMAVVKHQPGNILGGTLTFYMVVTAWMTARRPSGTPGLLDWGALLIVAGVAVAEVTLGVKAVRSPTGMIYEYSPTPYFVFGAVAALALIGDIRMLARGGIAGTQRLARHLWRMCFALFVAAVSIFLARQQLFPVLLQKTGALVFLSFLPLMLLVFWLLRVRFARAFKANAKLVSNDDAGGRHALISNSLENQLGRL